ncbi:MAG TPA: tRNA epoxyqueuosine(34) reductase QueG [Methylomirabilota bacterium]|jgi:epoxyqueuosine reductase|nr:tRNA epoxyqueuosine(34) reductase QueG [Methylomirabilota bacterium]
MRLTMLALTEAVKAKALGLGFERVAIGPADALAHARQFEQWLEAGYGEGMEWIEESRDIRLEPARLLPGVRSAVTVAMHYGPREDHPSWDVVSRYARGADYHNVMRPRLHVLRDYLSEAAGAGCRASLDTSAVLERDLAAAAGLGWIGKNTNLIAPRAGSYFFIGTVLTTAELVPDGPVADHCGTCTACLEACPTGAFPRPWVLDARRCLAYLTIEHHGDIPDELKAHVSDWLFGCDVCQDVCPWNRKAPLAREPELAPSAPLESLETLLGLDDAAFRARFRGTALFRAKRAGLARNAALVLGNRGERAAAPALRRALQDPDEGVRKAAAWALERLDNAL